jgi:Fic family protein
MDIHRSLANNTDDVIPGDIRFCSAYSEQLAIQIPAVANMDVMCQKISNVLYKMNTGKAPILQRAFDVHYEIIILQPFNDFNKRTARMIMNWFLITKGYRPIVFNYAPDNQEYMAALRDAANGNKKSYYGYMYKCMLRTQQDIIKLLTKSKTI